MSKATKFLQKKGLLAPGAETFEITGEFGTVILNELLEEFHQEMKADQVIYRDKKTGELRSEEHYKANKGSTSREER